MKRLIDYFPRVRLHIATSLTDISILGLIDGDETPETAAKRELEEETGFKAEGVLDSSPLLWSDPGLPRFPPYPRMYCP